MLKLMGIAYDKQFGIGQHVAPEVFIGLVASLEFRDGENVRVNFPMQRIRRATQTGGQGTLADISNDHQIDIASRRLFVPRQRTENKRDPDFFLVAQRFQQHIRQAGGFQDYAVQFRIKGMLPVCLIIKPIATASGAHQTKFEEFAYILLNGANRQSGSSLKLAQVKLPRFQTEQKPQQSGPDLGTEESGKCIHVVW